MTRRAVAGVCGLIALGALWLPWFEPEGKFVVLFGALDRQSEMLTPTAWQAFGWEDGALAAFAGATFALALAGRPWFVVPAAGAVFTVSVLIGHRSVEGVTNPLGATEAGLVPLVAFAAAAVASVSAGRYRLRR